MIRKIIISCSALLSCSVFSLQSQCVSDTTLKSPGYKPEVLPNATEGMPYSQSLSVLTPRDTTVMIGSTPVNVQIDSIRATGVYGMPSGLSYLCQDPRCVFVWDEVRCIGISGTCNTPGVYPITIPVIAYAKWGSTPISRPDTIRRFSIVVDPTAGIFTVDATDGMDMVIYPNPARDMAFISHPHLRSGERLEVFDATGRACRAFGTSALGLTEISLSGLEPGMYVVVAGGKRGSLLISRP